MLYNLFGATIISVPLTASLTAEDGALPAASFRAAQRVSSASVSLVSSPACSCSAFFASNS
jgi:hypothetical protein